MKKLFTDPNPPSQVQDLARSCFLSRRTLEKKWKAAWRGTDPIRLKELVDWALALRSRELCQAGLDSREIARILGIHPRTLDRIAGRLVGLSCRRWFALGHQKIWRKAAAWLSGDCRDPVILSEKESSLSYASKVPGLACPHSGAEKEEPDR